LYNIYIISNIPLGSWYNWLLPLQEHFSKENIYIRKEVESVIFQSPRKRVGGWDNSLRQLGSQASQWPQG